MVVVMVMAVVMVTVENLDVDMGMANQMIQRGFLLRCSVR